MVLDMSRISSYCDAFVVCHASNRRQVRAIAEGVVDDLRGQGRRLVGAEGMEASRWILIDFGDVIIHVFDDSMRGFYDLEALWGDAPRIEIPGITGELPRFARQAEPARSY